MKKLLILLVLFFASVSVKSQTLQAYNFTFTDEFGTSQKCYLTLKSIFADWSNSQLIVVFACYESKTIADRGTPAKRLIEMNLQGADFANVVLAPIAANEQGTLRAIALSDWTWSIAQTFKFVPNYTYDSASKTMVLDKKSLTDLNAVKVDVPLQ